ncbi:MAG: DUF2157 domain-containing protein [Brachymonas sp.]|nr:DUF2157 domain-containing protein [Brachymonas sp.]
MHTPLHQLAQQQHLNPEQTQALWLLAGLHAPPPDVHHRLRQALALVAALLLGAGLIFWVAANWEAQSRLFKLHLLQAAVFAPFAAAALLPARQQAARMALALLGILAVGGLLAYIGITYQTGADAWQLFAVWALLALPVALVLRSDGLWAAWLLIVATAIGMWAGRLLFHDWPWRSSYSLAFALMWLAVLAWPVLCAQLGLLRNAQGQPARPRISLWLAAVCALGAWSVRGISFLFEEWRSWENLPGYGLHLALVLLAAWRSRWRDLVVLGLAVFALDVMLLVLLGKWLLGDLRWDTDAFFLLFALSAAALLGGSMRWLYQQQKQAHAREEDAQENPQDEEARHAN